MKLFKKLILFLFFATSVFAQRRDTVYLNYLNNSTTLTNGYIANVTNNIGQNFHTFTIGLTQNNAGSPSCDLSNYFLANSFSAQMQASYNNVNYFNIPGFKTTYLFIAGNPNYQNKLYKGVGAYPFVRLVINGLAGQTTAPAGCSFNLNYSGTLDSSNLNDTIKPNIIQTVQGIGTSCFQLAGSGAFPNSIINLQVALTGLAISVIPTAGLNMDLYNEGSCTIKIATFNLNQGQYIQLPDIFNSSLYTMNPAFGNVTQGGSIWAKLSTGANLAQVITYVSYLN